MHSLRKFLTQSRLNLNNIPIWSAVWFTDASAAAIPPSPEWHHWQILDRDDLLRRPVSTALSSVLIQARRHLANNRMSFDASRNEPTNAQCQQLVARLRPRFELALSPADVQQQRDEERVSFLEEQHEALDLIEAEPRVLFSGAAGTGKTFLAIEAARRASLQDQTVRVLCFNRLLGAWLAQQLKGLPRTNTSTLHKAMLEAAQINSPPQKDSDWWRRQLPNLALETLFEADDPVDILIVDEAQDLCMPEYLDVMDLMLKGGLAAGRWLMFGDFQRQAIYGIGDGREALSLRSPSFVRPVLHHNCRNTPRVGQAAVQLTGLGNVYKRFRRPDDGVNVEYLTYTSPIEQELKLAMALDLLQKDHYPPEQIVILSPSNRSIARECTTPALRQRLHPYDSAIRRRVRYTTIHSFKGLDAPAVIVTDVEQAEGPDAEALLYVAFSRGCDRLIVLASEQAMHQMARNIGKGFHK
jgi:superfamily I DNA/RNA helicase